MPTPLLRGHVPGMGDSMPSERRAGHATLDEQGLPQNLGDMLGVGLSEDGGDAWQATEAARR